MSRPVWPLRFAVHICAVPDFGKTGQAALREFHLFRAFNITSEYKLQAAKEPNLQRPWFMQYLLKGKADFNIHKETYL